MHGAHGSHPGVFTCTHVIHGTRPVRWVSRPDGDWCLLCGEADHAFEDYGWVCMHHLFDDDATLVTVLDLQPHQEAERVAVGGPWIRGLIDYSEE